jgi:hypothetical protein
MQVDDPDEAKQKATNGDTVPAADELVNPAEVIFTVCFQLALCVHM